MSGPGPVRSWSLTSLEVGEGSVERLPPGDALPDLEWLRLPGAGVGELAARLRRARERALLPMPNPRLLALLGRIGLRFLDTADPLRRAALDRLPGGSGISSEMAGRVLDGMAADWTPERLGALVAAEFRNPAVLEGFAPAPERGPSSTRALGEPLLVQVVSGSVPGVSATALLRGLLVRSATLVKPGRGDVVLPLLWMEGLRDEAPELAEAAGVHYWPGGSSEAAEVEGAWIGEADRLVVYGGDEVVARLRERVRPGVAVVAYPHRVSVGLVAGSRVEPGAEERAGVRDETLEAAAMAISLFDGRGCVTPQVLFVEGSQETVELWARDLGEALDRVSGELPVGRLSASEASRILHLRTLAELEGAATGEDRVVTGAEGAWTILLSRASEPLDGTCPGRVVRVVAVPDLAEVARRLQRLAPHLQSAALEVEEGRRHALSEALARAGITRLTTLSRMAWPPAWWHHDGEGPLRPLVRWVDREGGEPASTPGVPRITRRSTAPPSR